MRPEITTPSMLTRSGTIPANGIDYYFELHGQGEPLLLLHGGLGSIDMYAPVLPLLAADREVICIDLHGHGRTPLGERPIDLAAIGDDLALLLDALGYERVDALGYSFGAGVAFRLAVQHPERVRRLVLVSAGYSSDSFYPEILEQQTQMSAQVADFLKDTPMYESYVAVAPNPEDFPRLLDQMGARMRQPFDYAEEVKGLTMPVMLVFGDGDMIRPDHIIDFYRLLGGGLRDAGWMREHLSPTRLAILPGLTHYDIFCAPQLITTALPFLNGEHES